MYDGRLNVSAGLAAYIKTVVKSEFAIHEKGNDIPMYAYYAYKLVNPVDPNGTTILYNNKPINEVIKEIKQNISTLLANENEFITVQTYSEGMLTKLDIKDYEKDKETSSEDVKKKLDTSEFEEYKKTMAANLNNKANSSDLTTLEGKLEQVETNKTNINDLLSKIEALTARVQALEDAAKGTEETT